MTRGPAWLKREKGGERRRDVSFVLEYLRGRASRVDHPLEMFLRDAGNQNDEMEGAHVFDEEDGLPRDLPS